MELGIGTRAKSLIEITGNEDLVFFTEYNYDSAIIGISHDDRVIYSYNKMIDFLVKTEKWTDEEAIEWIDYNTLRAIPYGGANAPIVLMDMMPELDD